MKEAKISMEQARKTALERVSGTIVEEEIERERGRLIYSFEIRDANRKIQEVEIDAMTGALICVEEDDDEDKKAAKPRDPTKTL
ncbi:MAG: PepSY domain-containing protein [Acidobacteriota bacterium]|nr:PepSY domain-containing protein [Acidobacteriota bacterium]